MYKRPDINKNIKNDLFEKLVKLANLGKDKNENFKFQILQLIYITLRQTIWTTKKN